MVAVFFKFDDYFTKSSFAGLQAIGAVTEQFAAQVFHFLDGLHEDPQSLRRFSQSKMLRQTETLADDLIRILV